MAISQSAVTTAIRELEEIVGSPLFQRSASGVALTETGRGFLNHAYNILSSVDEALRMPSADGRESGRLLLAASYTVIGYFLPYHLQRLSQLYPNLDIQLHELNRNAIEEGLIAHRYDMAVLLTSNVVNPELAVEHFFGSPRRLWVPARHPLLARDTVTLEDVAHEPFIMLTVDGPRTPRCATGAKRHSVPTCACAPRRWRRCAAWWPMAAAWRCCRTWSIARGRWKGAASRPSS